MAIGLGAVVALQIMNAQTESEGLRKRLFDAIRAGDLETVKRIYPEPLEVFTTHGASPLIDALLSKKPRIVEYLLQIGVDPNVPDRGNLYPIMVAPLDAPCLKVLLSGRVDIHVVDSTTGSSPLIVASRLKKTSKPVDLLLRAGANPNFVSKSDGATPLMGACEAGNVESVELLLRAGARKDVVDEDQKTALDYAKKSGSKAIIELLTKN